MAPAVYKLGPFYFNLLFSLFNFGESDHEGSVAVRTYSMDHGDSYKEKK